MKKIIFAASLATLLASTSLASQPVTTYPEMSNFIREELSTTLNALNLQNRDTAAPGTTIQSGGWHFARFFIEAYAKAAFHIPFLAKLEVYPELDLIFERDGFQQAQ